MGIPSLDYIINLSLSFQHVFCLLLFSNALVFVKIFFIYAISKILQLFYCN